MSLVWPVFSVAAVRLMAKTACFSRFSWKVKGLKGAILPLVSGLRPAEKAEKLGSLRVFVAAALGRDKKRITELEQLSRFLRLQWFRRGERAATPQCRDPDVLNAGLAAKPVRPFTPATPPPATLFAAFVICGIGRVWGWTDMADSICVEAEKEARRRLITRL